MNKNALSKAERSEFLKQLGALAKTDNFEVVLVESKFFDSTEPPTVQISLKVTVLNDETHLLGESVRKLLYAQALKDLNKCGKDFGIKKIGH
jgi:hypothetical protein